MTDTTTGPAQTPSLVKVLAALAELGEATAAAVAERAGLGYSTTTPKLRELEKSGQAEPFHAADRRTLWRPTESGHAAANGHGVGDDEVTTEPHADDANPTIGDVAAAPLGAPGGRPDTADEDTIVTSTGEADDGVIAGEQTPRGAASDDDEDTDTGQPGTATSPAGDVAVPHAPPARASAPVNDGTDDSEPDAGDATAPDDSDIPQPDGQTAADSGDTPNGARSGQQRRAKGALRGAVVDILENHPDRQYKVGELCKLINQGEQGSGAPKASAGAVANVLDKLAAAGIAVQTVAKPATFQLASRGD